MCALVHPTEDWHIDACNCTLGRAVMYGVMPERGNSSVGKSMNAAGLRLLVRDYDMVR